MHRKTLLALGLVLPTLLVTACGPQSSASGSGDALRAEVDGLLRSGNYAEALALLEGPRAAELSGADHGLRLATAQAALGELPKAVLAARETLAAHPEAHQVSVYLYEIYLGIGQYKLAAETLGAAREHGAEDALVALPMGVCLGRLGDLPGARAEFDRARAAGEVDSEVDYNLAVLIGEEGDAAEAERLLRAVLEASPEHPYAGRELARVLLLDAVADDERMIEAEFLVNTALDADPEDWRAYELIGDVSMLRGDVEAAVVYYTEALRFGRNPVHVEDKFRVAERARRQMLEAAGLIEKPSQKQAAGGPPLPVNLQERWKKARREREREEQLQAATPDDAAAESTTEVEDGEREADRR